MPRAGWALLCVLLVSPSDGQESAREPAREDFFPLAVGRSWTYEARDHAEPVAAGDSSRETIVKRVVGKRTIVLSPTEEVEAFVIEREKVAHRPESAPGVDSPPPKKTLGREFAVDRGDRVEIYAANRDGKTGAISHQRTRQWPRLRPQGAEFEEVVWLGRGGRHTWKVQEVEIDLPRGRAKGIRMRWMTEYTPEEGYEAVLAPGVGVVSFRSAVVPCRGRYRDYRETLLDYK